MAIGREYVRTGDTSHLQALVPPSGAAGRLLRQQHFGACPCRQHPHTPARLTRAGPYRHASAGLVRLGPDKVNACNLTYLPAPTDTTSLKLQMEAFERLLPSAPCWPNPLLGNNLP